MIKFALAGSPNVGKTSLFNRLTHSLEHTGNWHGVTVDKKEKIILYNHRQIKISDLPGLYSLTSYSPEECVSRDEILSKKYDLIINVSEVNNLARNLYLTLQLLELDEPIVLVVNMIDELRKQGKILNYRRLEKDLKIPVIPYSAKYHSDAHLLLDESLLRVEESQNLFNFSYLKDLPIDKVKEIICTNVKDAGLKLRYSAIKVLEKDEYIISKLNLDESQLHQLYQLGDYRQAVAAARYSYIDALLDGVIAKAVVDEHHETHEHLAHNIPIEKCLEGSDTLVDLSLKNVDNDFLKHLKHHDEHSERRPFLKAVSKLDKIFLNKYLALPLFFLIMALIFVVTFELVGLPLSDLMEVGLSRFVQEPVESWLKNSPLWLQSLISEGVISGVGGVLVFLPQIAVLFLFLAFLEDSGYISRVAFMTDGLFRKIGLSGRSAFTMLTGFGCSSTAIMTARGLEDNMTRKKTVILTPFFSCSAKMPVYAAIAGQFFSLSAIIIFLLYIIGVVTAILFAAAMQKINSLKSGKLSFILEIPPYRMPSSQRVLKLIYNNIKLFVIRVGTVIFALNVIVWVLSNFSLSTGFITPQTIGQSKSIMQSIAGLLAPVFKPLGFGDWKAVTALLSGLAAKELVVSTMDTMGGVSAIFGSAITAESQLTVFCFLIFTLLYCPCFSALAAMKTEIGFRWTLFGFVIYMISAYVFALVIRGIGLLIISHTLVSLVSIGVLLSLSILFFIIKRIATHKKIKTE